MANINISLEQADNTVLIGVTVSSRMRLEQFNELLDVLGRVYEVAADWDKAIVKSLTAPAPKTKTKA